MRVVAICLFAAWTTSGSLALASDQNTDAEHFFEGRVRPLFSEHCFDCHAGEVEDVEGALQMDSLEGLLRGGTRGPAIVIGKPEESLLVLAINHADQLHMPPKSKLDRQQIADIAEWIRQGAIWPNQSPRRFEQAKSSSPAVPQHRGDFPPEAREFWAFQRLRAPKPPAVRRRDWIRAPLDRFILARLEAEGVRPAREADPGTWLRRVTYDLTGLPPSPAELRRFLSDRTPEAYERVVDRLLSSPRYGEHWGRHWLDVARYADSNGLDENLAYANAFRYRDYVIHSFSADKPFDRFLIEQLAGDLLPEDDPTPRAERWTATGFLSIGAKMLAEDDPVKMQMDIVDEQLDTIGRAFMGLTLGCARCHDHKFDPLTSADYYGLAGILKSTTTMENFQVVARWQERAISERTRIEQHDRITAQLEALAKDDPRRAELDQQRPTIDYAMAVSEGPPEDLPIHIRGSHVTLGTIVPRRLPAIFHDTAAQSPLPMIPSDQSGRLQLAQWLTSAEHPLTARVIANRIWDWHFGSGLVTSTDNFGRLGQSPSHPELLDYLALELQRHDWSLQHLHRHIVLSATYRMSSDFNAEAAELDPENRFLWRMSRRRLTAEELRDSILAAGGSLDLQQGGSLLPTENRAYVTSTANVNPAIYGSRRRSVYLPVVRSALYDVFQAFDFPDPSVLTGHRQSTTVASQALFLMNSELVAEQASSGAALMLAQASWSDEQRIAKMYEILFGRPATDSERQLSLDYLTRSAALDDSDSESAVRRSWQSLFRALMTSNEFLYVD